MSKVFEKMIVTVERLVFEQQSKRQQQEQQVDPQRLQEQQQRDPCDLQQMQQQQHWDPAGQLMGKGTAQQQQFGHSPAAGKGFSHGMQPSPHALYSQMW